MKRGFVGMLGLFITKNHLFLSIKKNPEHGLGTAASQQPGLGLLLDLENKGETSEPQECVKL